MPLDAPRTFHAWNRRAPSKRALWDTAVTEVLAGIYEPDQTGRRKPECLYGAEKMWAHLQRQGIPVARCTVERLMRANGWKGVVRRKKVRTTEPDPTASPSIMRWPRPRLGFTRPKRSVTIPRFVGAR